MIRLTKEEILILHGQLIERYIRQVISFRNES